MRAIDRFALSFAPLMLRIVLAVTFIWSGAGKLFTTTELSAEQQAILQQIQANPPAQPESQSEEADQLPEPPAAEETGRQPGEQGPRMRSLTDPPAGPETDEPRAASIVADGYSLVLAQDQTGEPEAQQADEPASDAEPPVAAPVERRSVVNVALTIHSAVNPDRGSPRLPGFFADYAMLFAWAVTIIEFAGGVFLLLGLLTRLWAIGLTGVTAGIVWITSLGPAALGAIDNPFLGFLPPLWPFDPGAVMQFLWTFALFMISLSMIFLGPGAISLDRLFFGGSKSTASSADNPDLKLD